MEKAEKHFTEQGRSCGGAKPFGKDQVPSVGEGIGKPPRLDGLEISRHHNGRCRVNIWQQPEPIKNSAVTIAPRIGLSYYLTVSATGRVSRVIHR